MSRGPLRAAVAAAIVAVVALGIGYWSHRDEVAEDVADASLPDRVDGAEATERDEAESPFASRPAGAEATSDIAPTNTGSSTDSLKQASVPSVGSGVEPLAGTIDVTSLGHADLVDDDFEALVARLASDAALRAALIDELRAETDPARRGRLVQLLGDVGGADVTALAAELAYSSDPALRAHGLELLRHVQPGNDDARAIVSGLLTSATEPDTLLPTLQALARPGIVDDTSRGELASQVALLSTHDDAKVRRLGLDILSRWSVANDHVPVLLDGLRDADPGVRETAAYAFTRKPDAGSVAIEALLRVVADSVEVESVRRGAIRALDGMPLDPLQRQRIGEIERELDRR